MRGGYRKGAGRKKGYSALECEKARELIVRRVNESIEPILNSLIKEAKKGNIRAIRELFDRAYGRPSQSLEFEKGLDFESKKLLIISSESITRYGLEENVALLQ